MERLTSRSDACATATAEVTSHEKLILIQPLSSVWAFTVQSDCPAEKPWLQGGQQVQQLYCYGNACKSMLISYQA